MYRTYTVKKEQLIQTNPKTVHMLVLADKDFKVTIINMLKEWKENIKISKGILGLNEVTNRVSQQRNKNSKPTNKTIRKF